MNPARVHEQFGQVFWTYQDTRLHIRARVGPIPPKFFVCDPERDKPLMVTNRFAEAEAFIERELANG